MRTRMRQRGGLWLPLEPNQERVIVLPDGTRARVTSDDSGTVQHTETDDSLSAVVRPKPVRLKLRSIT